MGREDEYLGALCAGLAVFDYERAKVRTAESGSVIESPRFICARHFLQGGVPSSGTTDVSPNGDEYRVVCGAGSERVFVALVLALALLF